MLATEYTFVIDEVDGHTVISLTQTKTGKVKKFSLAWAPGPGLTRHMNSLTDEQCKTWFK